MSEWSASIVTPDGDPVETPQSMVGNRLDAETLRRLYWDEAMTQREMAQHLGVTKMRVVREMDRHNIPVRDTVPRRGHTNNGNWWEYEALPADPVEQTADPPFVCPDCGRRLPTRVEQVRCSVEDRARVAWKLERERRASERLAEVSGR